MNAPIPWPPVDNTQGSPTPAPLDPSKVKAGDTVTVHVVTIDSPAYDVSGETYMLGHALAVGGHVLTGPGVTLTAHQPAPEPEPEWKPGTVWADQEGERYWFTDNGGSRDDGEGPVFRNDVGDEFEASEMGSIRPLVVIDPADVDVVEVAKVMHQVDYPGLDFALNLDQSVYAAKARAALAHLGIEVAR